MLPEKDLELNDDNYDELSEELSDEEEDLSDEEEYGGLSIE